MNDYEYAPLVLFVYNRPMHVKKNLNILNAIKYVENTRLFIFSDAPKSEIDKTAVDEVRNYIEEFARKESKFKSVDIILSPSNKGLANSIIYGVSQIIHQFGQVIVLEDDLVVSNDFIEYMNNALEYYKDKKNIWSISGYTFPMKALDKYKNDVYIARRGCSWGWATWEDRWSTVDWDVRDYNDIRFNLKKRIDFGKWGQDLPFMLDANVYGYNHSWAIRWCYAAYKQNKYTVYPKISRVVSNGTDGSGTNYRKRINKYDSFLYEGNEKCKFSDVEESLPIRKEFRNHHMNTFGIIRASVKWGLIKRGIIGRNRLKTGE